MIGGDARGGSLQRSLFVSRVRRSDAWREEMVEVVVGCLASDLASCMTPVADCGTFSASWVAAPSFYGGAPGTGVRPVRQTPPGAFVLRSMARRHG